MATRPIDSDDQAFIAAHGRNGLDILLRYGVTEPTKLSPTKIGKALVAWRNDENGDRPSEINVIRAVPHSSARRVARR
jgi:hypothetical protein